MQPVENIRRASAPRKGGNARPSGGIPWGSRVRHLRRPGRKEREGQREGRCFPSGPADASPGGAQAQESNGSTRSRILDRARDARLASRAGTAGAPPPSRRVWRKSVGAELLWETMGAPRGRRKALKGEAQERGKLKKASESRGADTAEGVAKPRGRGFWRAWHGLPDAWREPGEKKGSSVGTC